MKLYRLLFVGKAFLLLVSIYLINHSIPIGDLLKDVGLSHMKWDLPNVLSYIVYFAIPIFLTYRSINTFNKLDPSEIKGENIHLVESASATFLPTFFAYIFVGLSINNYSTLICIYIVLTILCFCAEIYLYNPIFHLLGYRFYFVTAGNNKVLIMTKKNIKLNEPVEFNNLGQINDFTYVDLGKKKGGK